MRILRTSGFTLIEMLIAIALGVVIITTCAAGFRVASQSISVANRLALENTLMRSGYFAAVEEADYWESFDDPNATPAPATSLRGSASLTYHGVATARGMAFTPLTQMGFTCAAPTNSEADRGWDSAYQWPASDPRGWYHGQIPEFMHNIDGKFGFYEVFTHLSSAPNLSSTALVQSANLVAYGVASPLHTWLPNQLEGMKNALGYYGLYDYFPANTFFGYYGHGDWGDQSLSHEWSNPDSPNTASPNGSLFKLSGFSQGYDYSTVNGRNNNTNSVSFPIVPASGFTEFRTDTLAVQDLVSRNHSSWVTNTYQAAGTSAGVSGFLGNALVRTPLMTSRPAYWPELRVQVARYANQSRFATLCRISWRSPLTGATAEAAFTVLSTTLRGARQQRRQGGGWATWTNSISDPILRTTDATLDSP